MNSVAVTLSLQCENNEVLISYESPFTPRFNPNSADNACAPEPEYIFNDDETSLTSRHRIVVQRDGEIQNTRVLLATGGCSGVHEHSAFIRKTTCFVAVGAYVCALEIPTLKLLWFTRTDSATCFGVHNAENHESLISHGELDIARLTYAGQLLWSASGGDIFTNGFKLHEQFVEAIDFNETQYRFDIATGKLLTHL